MANYMYLTDTTLPNKLTLFRGKGVSDSIIKDLLEQGLLTDSLENITKKIELLEVNGQALTEDNLKLLKKDLAIYYKRVDLLKSLGIELDANELRNHIELIINTPYLEEDIEILKHYMIRIVRKNGKYALEIFWKNPTELTMALDAMIEASLEDVIVGNPEAIALNADELIKRIKYCRAQGVAYYNRERETAESYVINPLEFTRTYPVADLSSIDVSAHNDKIQVVANNEYVANIIATLNNYYSAEKLIVPELTEEQKEINRQLIETFEKNFKVETLSPNTILVGGIAVSKKKIERNLMFIIDILTKEGQQIQGLEKEIILTAILYNLNASEEAMKQIADSAMGFNQSVGGPTL